MLLSITKFTSSVLCLVILQILGLYESCNWRAPLLWYLEAVSSANISKIIWWTEISDLAHKEAGVISMWSYSHNFQIQPWFSSSNRIFPITSSEGHSKRSALVFSQTSSIKNVLKNVLVLLTAQISGSSRLKILESSCKIRLYYPFLFSEPTFHSSTCILFYPNLSAESLIILSGSAQTLHLLGVFFDVLHPHSQLDVSSLFCNYSTMSIPGS